MECLLALIVAPVASAVALVEVIIVAAMLHFVVNLVATSVHASFEACAVASLQQ